MKNNKINSILKIIYIIMLVIIFISIFNMSVVDKVDSQYIIDNNIKIEEVQNLVLILKVIDYSSILILIAIGLIFTFINNKVLKIINFVILAVIVILSIIKISQFDDRILSESAEEGKYGLDYEVELVLYKEQQNEYSDNMEYMENLLDILVD